jgi:hypothetical protein
MARPPEARVRTEPPMFATYRPSDRIIPRRDGSALGAVRPIVVIVPGLTGTELLAPDGDAAWGSGLDLFRPHDGGYAIARAIGETSASSHELVPGKVIEYLRFGRYAKRVYGPMLRTFEENGFARGELDEPFVDGDVFLFAYDWREDNVRSSRRLHARLERLRCARGGGSLRVVLIGQSNGAHICRYFCRYGNADLAHAESHGPLPPAHIDVAKLVLVGAANGGSIRNLRELHRGRQYVPMVGRRVQPEVLFTFETLLQDLPTYCDDHFVDAAGRSVRLDLWDPDVWRHYGWSAFAADAQARMQRAACGGFGTPARRFDYLADALERAKRFRNVLLRDSASFVSPPLFMIRNVHRPTSRRAVVHGRAGHGSLLFTGDRSVARDAYLHASTSTGGDGHAGECSQMALCAAERSALEHEPLTTDRGHFRLSFGPAVLNRLLDIVLDT